MSTAESFPVQTQPCLGIPRPYAIIALILHLIREATLPQHHLTA